MNWTDKARIRNVQGCVQVDVVAVKPNHDLVQCGVNAPSVKDAEALLIQDLQAEGCSFEDVIKYDWP